MPKELKALLAKNLAQRVRNGDVIGLGSGSTAELALIEIAKRITNEGITVSGVATSFRTTQLAEQAGIRVFPAHSSRALTWAFDGADEVDAELNMIKGRGAAMLMEKLVARRSPKLCIIVTEDKLVSRLGSKFPVPVEVIPEAVCDAEIALKALGADVVDLRQAVNKYGPEITEHNNLILDARFDKITVETEAAIKSIIGVVESGLFFNFNPEVLVARDDGIWSRRTVDGKVVEQLV